MEAKIRRKAEAMTERFGHEAINRALEHLNARIDASDNAGRDYWVQVVHALHTPNRQQFFCHL